MRLTLGTIKLKLLDLICVNKRLPGGNKDNLLGGQFIYFLPPKQAK